MTASSILGEWSQLPNPCVGKNASITFGGQSTYILPLKDGGYMFMADMWQPKQSGRFTLYLVTYPI